MITRTIRKERMCLNMQILQGKKAVVIGDRDGIPGPSIGTCLETAGAEVVYNSTECFV